MSRKQLADDEEDRSERVNRRPLLTAAGAATAAALGGCLGGDDGGGSGDDGGTDDADSGGGSDGTDAESADGGDETATGEDADTFRDWPFYRGDPGNTGFLNTAGPFAGTGETETDSKWSKSSATTSPVVADETVYVGDDDRLFAYDAATGELEWDAFTEDKIRYPSAYHDGTVYAGCSEELLYAFDADGGDEEWRTELDVGSITAGLLVADDAVVAVTDDGHVAAYEARTGDRRWAVEVDEERPVAIGDGTVYVSDGALSAVDLGSGDRVGGFENPNGTPFSTPPVYDDGTVYVGDREGYVYALDAETWTAEWEFRTGGVSASPGVADDEVYVVDDDLFLYAIDAESGDERWRADVDTAGGIAVEPVVTTDAVYVGTNADVEDNFFAYDRETRELLEGGDLPFGNLSPNRYSIAPVDDTLFAYYRGGFDSGISAIVTET